MSSNQEAILAFETRVRQMILHFKQLKKENSDLRAEIEKGKQEDDADYRW